MKKWRENNVEKNKATQKRYNENNKDKRKIYLEENKEKRKLYDKAWKQKNKEQINFKNREKNRIKREIREMEKKDKIIIKTKIIVSHKTCTKCHITKEIEKFNINKASKDGHHPRCKECRKLDHKKYYTENREKSLLTSKKWHENNPEKTIGYKRKWKKNNRKKERDYQNNRLKTDPLYKLEQNIRTLINSTFRRKSILKTGKTREILGCSFEEFKTHLEKQFQSWMNWENRGKYNGKLNYGWDLDHKIPIYSAKTEEDIIKLNHYTNFQPLCSKVNRDIKRNNIWEF